MINSRLQTTRYTSRLLVPLSNFIQILLRFVPVDLIVKHVLRVLLGFVGYTGVVQGANQVVNYACIPSKRCMRTHAL